MVKPALPALTPSDEPMALSAGRLMSMPKEGSAANAPSISAKAVEWGDTRTKYLTAGWGGRLQRSLCSSGGATPAAHGQLLHLHHEEGRGHMLSHCFAKSDRGCPEVRLHDKPPHRGLDLLRRGAVGQGEAGTTRDDTSGVVPLIASHRDHQQRHAIQERPCDGSVATMRHNERNLFHNDIMRRAVDD